GVVPMTSTGGSRTTSSDGDGGGVGAGGACAAAGEPTSRNSRAPCRIAERIVSPRAVAGGWVSECDSGIEGTAQCPDGHESVAIRPRRRRGGAIRGVPEHHIDRESQQENDRLRDVGAQA